LKNKINLFRESLRLVWQSTPGWTTAGTVISVVRSFLPLLLLFMLRKVIDEITTAAGLGGVSVTPVMVPAIILVAIWFLDEVLSDISTYVNSKQSMRFEDHMYGLLHSKATRLDLINFENAEYYDRLSRAAREATWRPNNILTNLVSLSRTLISVVLMAGLILTFHWLPALLLAAANVPGILLRLHFAGELYNFKREQTPEARKTTYFNWLLTGDRPSRELRLFGLGDYFRDLFRKSFLKQKEEELGILRKKALTEIVSDLFKAAAFLFTVVFIARQTIAGEITLGEMAMFLVAFRQGMVYIREMFSSLAGLYEDGLFIGDTFEFLNLTEKITAREPVKNPASLSSGITAANLTFAYPGNSLPTIDNISFDLKKGEILAVVGPNGAGKSTLVRLLCRLYDPDSGSIKYNGEDIKHYDPVKYRKYFSVIFQDFMLYNLQAGENIRLGNLDNGNGNDDKMKEAAKSAGIHNLIESLPHGYDTMIGTLFNNSRELSWGEWQKIALSRALYRDSEVLILDEPSSALDADTENEVFSRFREIVKGRTCVLISHRFTNVSLADRIIVLDKGRIIEQGSHRELIKRGGTYYSMYTKQSSRFEL
jgi:ATP-binding cassette, subfamily B, bacterial